MIKDRGLVIRLGLCHHHNMVQQHVRIWILRNQNVRGDHVARMQLAQNARVLQLVGMVIASMKPGIASWFSVTSPLDASVETTLPRSLYTLKFWLAADCVGAC